MVRKPNVSLDRDEFLARKSDRLTHDTKGGPSLPCGFFLEIIEEGDRDARSERSPFSIPDKMSSLAGNHESRARARLVEERAEYLKTDTHAGYTHEYYRIELGDLVL